MKHCVELTDIVNTLIQVFQILECIELNMIEKKLLTLLFKRDTWKSCWHLQPNKYMVNQPKSHHKKHYYNSLFFKKSKFINKSFFTCGHVHFD